MARTRNGTDETNRRIESAREDFSRGFGPNGRLERAMEARGLSAVEVARQVGSPPSALYFFLHRERLLANARLSLVLKLAEALGVPMEYFVEPDDGRAERMLSGGERDFSAGRP